MTANTTPLTTVDQPLLYPMKNRITFILLLWCVTTGHAQQDPLYSQYLNNPILLNPAYAGSNQQWQTTAGYRTQWSGFDGNPTTLNFSSHLSLVDNKVGLGFIAIQDKIGETKNTEFNLNYSYRLEVKENKYLYFGLSTGMVRYNSDPGLLNLQVKNDPSFYYTNEFQFNTGVGVMMKTEQYMIGFSVPKLIPTSINQADATVQVYNQHLYLFGVFTHNFNERLMLKPALLFKGVKGAPISIDVNVNLVIDQSYTVGLLTRNLNTLGFLAQIKMNQYKLGYVFEMPTNQSEIQRFLSHEISLTYSLPFLDFHDRSMFSNF
jgi:type IX secretion system PorP/SprF family membrane protein